jgi:hypothetical protein
VRLSLAVVLVALWIIKAAAGVLRFDRLSIGPALSPISIILK